MSDFERHLRKLKLKLDRIATRFRQPGTRFLFGVPAWCVFLRRWHQPSVRWFSNGIAAASFGFVSVTFRYPLHRFLEAL